MNDPTVRDDNTSKDQLANKVTGNDAATQSGDETEGRDNASLHVIAMGDVFVERFLWAGAPKNQGVPQTPYTWPDELRSRAYSETYVELSGTPLHRDIYDKFLTAASEASNAAERQLEQGAGSEISKTGDEEAASTLPQTLVEAIPSRANVADAILNDLFPGDPKAVEALSNLGSNDHKREREMLESALTRFKESFTTTPFPLDGTRSPFPVYLHELKPFPLVGTGLAGGEQKAERKVWRIFESQGEVRSSITHVGGGDRGGDPAASESPSAIRSLHETLRQLVIKRVVEISGPTVIVLCDRNAHKGGGEKDNGKETDKSIRGVLKGDGETFAQRMREAVAGRERQLQHNVLVLWHTRHPFHSGNAIADFLAVSRDRRRRVIPIVNAQCLRDAGVPLRFDVAFERTARELIAATEHDAIAFLLRFPHAIIRFDYGVIHLSAEDGDLKALDIHAFNAGSYAAAPTRHGMVTGMTPLLVCAILSEIQSSITARAKSTVTYGTSPLDDILSLNEEGRLIEQEHPTIQYSTRLDRAIDKALLLGRLHFLQGYGDSGGQPFQISEEESKGIDTSRLTSASLYARLAKQFFAFTIDNDPKPVPEQDEKSCEKPGDNGFSFRVKEKFPLLDKIGNLTRISVPKTVFGGKPHHHRASESFSRCDLLMNESFMKYVAQVPFDEYDKQNKNFADAFDKVLLRLVTHGIGYVVDRGRGPDGRDRERVEPSVAVPFVTFGMHQTLIANEIDAYLEVRYLAEKYIAQEEWATPLAIAVFGRPGSGKSSVVRQILGSVAGCRLERSLECNVAQWTSVEHLTRHLHRVRDYAMDARDDAKIPVVFFDEFDAKFEGDVGWLKYFLMPLQDGLYMDKDDKFHIGRSIFVFAGGVSQDFAEFQSKFRSLQSQKVTDFMGRLRAYINVPDLDLPDNGGDAESARVKIRRAVFLRSTLMRNMHDIFDHNEFADVAPSVVMAIINAKKYEHGLRSMEAIVQMSRVPKGARSFQPSALPPKTQLATHVDADAFMRYFTG
jgi:hypothetical protein